MTRPQRGEDTSRRRVLKTAGIVGSGLAGISGVVTGKRQQVDEIIEFTGYVPGWIRTVPGAKEEGPPSPTQLNPTLQLDAGKRYEIRWTNGDGVGHSFIIRDKNGAWVAGTELAFGVGTSKSFRFTATKEMASYFCTVHPVQMRGKVTVNGQANKGPNTNLPKDISPVKKKSTVTFKKQTVKDRTVTVKSTTLPKGGFVTIHTPILKKQPRTIRKVKKSVVGWSEYLEPGTHENVSIKVEKAATKHKKLIAMNHRDSNKNQNYDFVTSNAAFADADWPYFTPKGRPVISPAKVTFNGGGN